MQKIAILKAANKKSSLKRPIWDAIYSRRKNKIHAHGLKKSKKQGYKFIPFKILLEFHKAALFRKDHRKLVLLLC